MSSPIEIRLNAYHMRVLEDNTLKKQCESKLLVEIIDGFQDIIGKNVYSTLHV